MIYKNMISTFVVLFSFIFLIGCGGDDESSRSSNVQETTGQFIDAPVENLTYVCSSGKTSLTDTNGTFICPTNDTITFKVSSIILGSSSVQNKITPFHLYSVKDKEKAYNISQLLHSFDNDSDPDNNIKLDLDLISKLTISNIDISSDKDIFENELTSVLATQGKSIYNREQARAKMLDYIDNQNDITGLNINIQDELDNVENNLCSSNQILRNGVCINNNDNPNYTTPTDNSLDNNAKDNNSTNSSNNNNSNTTITPNNDNSSSDNNTTIFEDSNTTEVDFEDDYTDIRSQASLIQLDTIINGDLEYSTDIDYFKFTLISKTTIQFQKKSTLGNVNKSNNSSFSIYDINSNKLLAEYIEKDTLTTHSLSLNGGTYYIKVSTFSSNLTGYQFEIKEVTNLADDHSNNKANASVITLGTKTTGNLELSNDIDYLKFSIDQKANLSFERISAEGNVGQKDTANFEVYDINNSSLLQDLIFAHQTSTNYLVLDQGTYFIKVSTYSNNITGYDIILNSHAIPTDDFNNTKANARQIDNNATINGSLEVSDDIDYFKFTIIKDQTTIQFDRKSTSAYTTFNIYNSEDQLLLESFIVNHRRSQDILTLNSGTYHIKVTPYTSNQITDYEINLIHQ